MDDSLTFGPNAEHFHCQSCGTRLDFQYCEGGHTVLVQGECQERSFHYAGAICHGCSEPREFGADGEPEDYAHCRFLLFGLDALKWPEYVGEASTAFWQIIRHSFDAPAPMWPPGAQRRQTSPQD